MFKKVYFTAFISCFCIFTLVNAQVVTQIAHQSYENEPEEVITAVSPNGQIFRGDNIDITASTFRLSAFDQAFNLLQSTEISGFLLHSAMAADEVHVYLNLQFYQVNNFPIVLPGIGEIDTDGFLYGTLLVAFDHELELQWHHFYGANEISGFSDSDVLIRHNGNILFNVFEDNPDYFVYFSLKEMNQDGAVVNEMTQSNLVYTMTEDAENNLYITGSCAQQDAYFNGTEVTMTNDYNFYLVKYDASGNYMWSNYVEEITCSVPDITVVSPDEIYLCVSMLNNTYNFDNHAITIDDYIHFIVAKMNGNGQFDWVKTVSRNTEAPGFTEIYHNRFLTNDGQYLYFAGNAQGSIEWNNNTAFQSNKYVPFIAQLDLEGNVMWVEAATNVDFFADAHQLSLSPTNELILSGTANGSMQLDTVAISGNSWSAWMARILPYDNPTGLCERDKLVQWQVYPNPAGKILFVDVSDPKIGKVQFTIYDLSGRLIRSPESAVEFPTQLDLTDISSGMYLLKMESADKSSVQRFVMD